MPPLVGVEVEFVPPRAIESVPATSAVARSIAFVVEPEPAKIDEVSVLETIASVTESAGKERVPADKVSPFDAVNVPVEVNAPAVKVPVTFTAPLVFSDNILTQEVHVPLNLPRIYIPASIEVLLP